MREGLLPAAVLVGAFCVLFGVTACTDTITEPRAASTPAGSTEYGVVARPPLPQAEPVIPLDGDHAIADHDGSVVVLASGATVHFIDADVSTSVTTDAGPSAKLRAVSADGSRAALFEELDTSSRITVVDRSSGEANTATYELPGLVEPEAFSTDGGRLFVIDHQVSTVPGAYRVRPFDLATGQLQDILGPTKLPFDDDMNGVGRRQVWSPNGDRLYTLYVRQTHHHHHHAEGGEHAEHDPNNSGHGEAGTDGFVHVLDLKEEWAFCLDLPEAFGRGPLETAALAVSTDGRALAVADVTAGAMAFASTEDLAVTETVPLAPMDLSGELHLGLLGSAQDSRTVFLASGTEGHWFDGQTGRPLEQEPARFDNPVLGITAADNALLVWTSNLARGPVRISGFNGLRQSS